MGPHTQAGDSSQHHGVGDVRHQAGQQDGQHLSVYCAVYLVLLLHAAAQTPHLIHGIQRGFMFESCKPDKDAHLSANPVLRCYYSKTGTEALSASARWGLTTKIQQR